VGDDDDIEEQIRRLSEERQRRLVVVSQHQAQTAREQALGAGAREWAVTLLQQGLAQEEEGRVNFQRREYTAAQQAYQQAASLFERAYEEAQAVGVVQKTQQARQEMAAAKAEAEHYGARERARTFYSRGLALEAQAEEAWEQKVYPQATDAYREAQRFFADARDLAYREALREEAEAARQQALTAKAAAEREGASALAAILVQEAGEAERKAQTAIEHEEFTQARELYLAAYQKYLQAQHQAQT
jgi:colicin import membrane protein